MKKEGSVAKDHPTCEVWSLGCPHLGTQFSLHLPVGFFQDFYVFYDVLEHIHGLQERVGAV